MSRTNRERRKSGSAKPRRAKAEAELAAILVVDRHLQRRATAAAITLRLAPILLPLCLRFTLDPITDRESVAFFGRQWSPESLLALTVAIGMVVALIRAVASGFFIATAGRLGHSLVARLRVAMFEHILRLPVKYLDRRGCGRVMLRFMGDSDALRGWVSRTRPTVVADAVLLVALVVALALVSWHLGLAAAAALPVVIAVIWTLRPALYRRTLEARQLQARFTGHIEARLRAKRQVTWLDRYAAIREPTRELAERIAERNAHRDRQSARVEAAAQLLSFGLLPWLLAGGIELLWSGRLAMGKFVAASWLVSHMMVTLHRLSRSMIIREKAGVSIDRILRLLERTAERGRSRRLESLKVERPVLECRELVFSDTGVGSAQQPFSQRLEGPGIAILPRNLSLSAFRDVLLCFERPASGTILLDGQRLGDRKVRSVRRAIGWIGDEPLWIEGTILENIAAGAPSLNREELRKRLQRYDLGILDLDEWLDRLVEANGHNMSPDDALRISFYRAILNRPYVLLITAVGEISDGMRELFSYQLARWGDRRGLVLIGYSAMLELQVEAAVQAPKELQPNEESQPLAIVRRSAV